MLNIKKLSNLFYVVFAIVFIQGCAAVVAGTAATGILVAQDRRTAGTIVEDNSIQLKAKNSIRDILTENKSSRVSIISYNNNVLLLGQTPTPDIKNKIEESIRNVAKVKNLHNEIAISGPTSLMTRSSDTWITTKIKSDMILNKDINPTRVKVVTEDGIVYLLGLIKPTEEKIAVDISRHTKGVKKVVKMLEHLPT